MESAPTEVKRARAATSTPRGDGLIELVCAARYAGGAGALSP
jgi:hypothetical protein